MISNLSPTHLNPPPQLHTTRMRLSLPLLLKTMAPTTPPAVKSHRPIVISGPSGSGKSTIITRLMQKYPSHFGFSISHTTRSPRPNEKDGVNYHFVDIPACEKLIEEGGFIEYTKFTSKYYGTSVKAVEDVAEAGRVCVLDIEMEGVKSLRAHETFSKTARFLFLQPPSTEVLAQRLRGRGDTSEEDMKGRLEQAAKEIEFAKTGVHDKVVVNDDLERCWQECEDWVFEEVEGKKP